LENVYQSSKIYGCDFTLEEVKNFILTGETTAGKDFFDYVVIQNIYDAEIWFYNQFDHSFEVSLQTIIELNNKLLQGIEFRIKDKQDFMVKTKIMKGDLRKGAPGLVRDNTIEREEEYISLKTKMQNMLTEFHYTHKPSLEQIVKFFGTFLKIRPFDMGNGRTLRILINYFFMKANYPLLSFDYDDKNIFQEAIADFIHNGDITKLFSYFEKRLEIAILNFEEGILKKHKL
jgi:Fic family protein